jgi:peptidyl-prolyl cis-trans isomerase SurA
MQMTSRSRFVAVAAIALIAAAPPGAVGVSAAQIPPTGGLPMPGMPDSRMPAPEPRRETPPPPDTAPLSTSVPAPRPSQPNSTIVERVLVRVNGEILTQTELTQKQAAYLREQQLLNLPDAELQARLAEITPMLLEDAVDELLLVQRGREMGVTFTDSQFTQALENIKKQNNLTEEQLNQELAKAGLTREQLRQDFERTALVQAVQAREIGPSMTITQPEVRQYYAAHPERFMTPETVTLRQLLISVPSRPNEPGRAESPAAEAAARARIEDLRTKAIAGADFAELVRENSDTDANAKANGGLVGPVLLEDLNPALKDPILKLQPGEITEPIRTQGGFQILKLENRAVPELRPFESVRAEIESAIRNERLPSEQEKVLERLRSSAVIEWKDEDLRAMYEKRVETAGAADTTAAAAGSQ